MPASPQLRFLMRAAGALAISLALWWWIFSAPMLSGLRAGTEFAMRFLPGDGSASEATIQANGDWALRIPVPTWIGRMENTQRLVGRVSKDAPMVRVRGMRAPIPGNFPLLFTVSLPFFWALWVAAPGRGNWRGLAAGTAVLAVIGVLSMVVFAVHTAIDTLHVAPTGASGMLYNMGFFLTVDALPYAGPILLAIGLHAGLQSLMFSGEAPAEEAPVERKRRRRSR